MEIIIAKQPGGSPPYPNRKVVVVADRAEVAEVPCDGVGSENIIYHADLLALVSERHPDLAEVSSFTAGWLTQTGNEATLYLAAGSELSATEAERIGEAMSDWCNGNRVTKLTITDTTRSSGAEKSTAADWGLFSTATEGDEQ
jgi:hypothetical protein